MANASGAGYSILTKANGLTAYSTNGGQLGTIPAGDLDPTCGVLDITVPGVGRALVTQLDTTQPAQGLTPAKSQLSVSAWKATSGAQIWNAVVERGGSYCGPSENDFGPAPYLNATPNGEWIAESWARTSGSVINARTGAVRHDPHLSGTIGNFMLDNYGYGDQTGQIGTRTRI